MLGNSLEFRIQSFEFDPPPGKTLGYTPLYFHCVADTLSILIILFGIV